MLSDTSITIAGHAFNSLQLLGVGALLLGVAALLLAFSRERRMRLSRSAVTDELAIHMGRIADSLERITMQLSDRASWQAVAQQKVDISAPRLDEPVSNPPERHVALSMFGR
jgi:hypothetical protein